MQMFVNAFFKGLIWVGVKLDRYIHFTGVILQDALFLFVFLNKINFKDFQYYNTLTWVFVNTVSATL